MSGFFSEQDSHNGSAKSDLKFNTNDLLNELNQMRAELQHHIDIPQKSSSSNRYEEPLIDQPVIANNDKKPIADSLHSPSLPPVKPQPSGYTPSHQFRIDPPHPEIGEKRDEVKARRDPVPRFPVSEGIPLPEDRIELSKKDAMKNPVSRTEETQPHSQDPLEFLAASKEPQSFPSETKVPPHKEVIYAKAPADYPEYPTVIPISAKQQGQTPLNPNPAFRIDSRHYSQGDKVFEQPKIPASASPSKEAYPNAPQMSLNEMLTAIFMTLGLGALVCSGLLYLRALLFQFGPWSAYGIPLILVGAVCCLLGMFFRSYGNKPLSQPQLSPQPRESLIRYDQGETQQLKKTYKRLLELRHQVDEMITHVEKKVVGAPKGGSEKR